MQGLTLDGQPWDHRASELVRAIDKHCVCSLDREDYQMTLLAS